MDQKRKINSYRFIKPLLNIHLDNPYAYSLLAFLCHAAKNETGISWHGHASITYATGMREKAIRSATKALVEMKVISCQIRGTVTKRETNLYTVHYDRLTELEDVGRAGRKAFILSQRARKAEWQRKWRGGSRASCEADVECSGASTAECAKASTVSDVECAEALHVERAGASYVECAEAPQTTKQELCNMSTTNSQPTAKETTDNSESISLDDQISATRGRLAFWQNKAKGSPSGAPDIGEFNDRIKTAQMRLDQLMAKARPSPNQPTL